MLKLHGSADSEIKPIERRSEEEVYNLSFPLHDSTQSNVNLSLYDDMVKMMVYIASTIKCYDRYTLNITNIVGFIKNKL